MFGEEIKGETLPLAPTEGGVGVMGTEEGVESHSWWIKKITSRINPKEISYR